MSYFFWLGILNLKKHKALKKELNEELMHTAWFLRKWWNFCMSEDQKKEIKQFLLSNTFSVYTILVLKCFVIERLDMVQKSL